MKLLSSTFSSSSSWSSSSTISTASPFDSKSATASYLAGIFRRILCSGTLPTHPSDHVNEKGSASRNCFHKFDENGSNREAGPGLVARLMGLDSMPETDFRASIARSRSMGSEDRARDSRHTRVKSSASFRELPTFLALEDKEFLVLSFESASDRGRDFNSKPRRRVREKKEDFEETKKVLRDLNEKDTTKRRNSVDHKRLSNEDKDPKLNLAPKKQLRQLRYVGSESYPNVTKPGLKKKRKKKKKNMEVNFQDAKLLKPVELKSEDLSPVSVLDSGQFLVDPKVPISACDSSSRRKLSLEVPPNPRRDKNLIGTKELKQEISRENSNALDEIWRASEAELVGPSWARRWDFGSEDFRGVGQELEALIIGHLIDELVHQHFLI